MNLKSIIASVLISLVCSVGTVYLMGGSNHSLGAALACTDGSATCLPTLELTGKSGYSSLQVDTGLASLAGELTVSGGTLNVTTANTATSTVVAGCYQFYATSTATSLKYQASTTPGIMYSQYGTCPNL